MIDPLVRPARSGDEAALAELEREARAALVDQRGGGRWLVAHPEIAERWRELVEQGSSQGRTNGRFSVFVAHIDDVVVGYLVAHDDVEPDGDTLVRVDQVWVTPEARELGFGDELLAAAIEAGRAAGAVAVEGQALPGDRHTKNLYERAGIVARLITTYRRFD